MQVSEGEPVNCMEDTNVATSTSAIEEPNTTENNLHGEQLKTDKAITMSKNQLKRKLKAEKWDQIKILKKAQKEEIKAKKAEAQQVLGGTSNSDGNGNDMKRNRLNETEVQRKERKEKEKLKYLDLCNESFAVVIDCSWEQDHTDRPLKSLSQQILFCYGINKRTAHPSKLYLTGLGPRLLQQISKNNINEWLGVIPTQAEYMDVVKDKELIYLTSDATETLQDLQPNCAFIIGGIVDRNSMKGATFAKASGQGIRTMKLPIKEYCKMRSTPVLTVNHVFEILIRYKELGSWISAFEKVLPQRKGAQTGQDVDSCPVETYLDKTKEEEEEEEEEEGAFDVVVSSEQVEEQS